MVVAGAKELEDGCFVSGSLFLSTPIPRALFVASASLLPFNKHAFWLRKHKAAISKVTFGLDSYTAPTTPKGTFHFSSNKPFANVFFSNILFDGFGKEFMYFKYYFFIFI